MKQVIPFGKYKGRPISNLPADYLRWLSQQTGGDLDYWAKLAYKQLEIVNEEHDLDSIADDFLRQHGYNPDRL